MATFKPALSLALALLAPAAAAVTIDFDDFEPGTVTDEYQGSGVRFIGSFGVTNSNFGGVVTAPSLPNLVQVARPAVQIVRFVNPASPTGRATTGSVSVDTPALSGGCFDAIDMDAFDADGVLLDTTQIPAVSPTTPGFTTTLTVAGIHEIRFTVIGNQCIAPFDNLVFDAVVPVSLIFSDSFESPP
jgi:hypothetical protein